MLGDAVDQVSMGLPTHEDIELFIGKDIKQHHEQHLKAAYQTQQMQEEVS